MDREYKTGFVAKHAKSSALFASIVVHAILIVVALTFVAVSVVVKNEVTFETKTVSRPKLNLRRLQVPVNVKKTSHQPKLRKQIVAVPTLSKTPEISLPEIVGVKGGVGASGIGSGGGASLGFSMPEINLFGIKGKSEKTFFALDASEQMMVDEIGGVRSYEIIKSETIRILKQLNSTVLFNVAVYQDYSAKMLFPEMVPANEENVSKAVAWLEPLNRFTSGRSSQDQYGAKTTGEGGLGIDSNNQIDPLKGNVSHWSSPVMEAMKEQADTVFVLTAGWGFLAYKTADSSGWSASEEERFQTKVVEAKKKLAEDNARRAAAGDPPRIIPAVNYERNLVEAYFKGEPLPPFGQYVQYTPLDLVKAFINVRKNHASEAAQTKLGLKKKEKKADFTVNVIQFCKEGDPKNDNFVKLTGLLSGEYRAIEGAKAIESYVEGGD